MTLRLDPILQARVVDIPHRPRTLARQNQRIVI